MVMSGPCLTPNSAVVSHGLVTLGSLTLCGQGPDHPDSQARTPPDLWTLGGDMGPGWRWLSRQAHPGVRCRPGKQKPGVNKHLHQTLPENRKRAIYMRKQKIRIIPRTEELSVINLLLCVERLVRAELLSEGLEDTGECALSEQQAVWVSGCGDQGRRHLLAEPGCVRGGGSRVHLR